MMSHDFEEQPIGNDESVEADLTMAKSNLAGARKKTAPKDDGDGVLTVDVYKTDGDVVIKSAIAGVTAGDLDITINNDMVIIKGMRESGEKVRQSDYYWQELYWGPFSRTVILPEEIDVDGAKAAIKDGVLTIKLPKVSKNNTRKT